MACKLSVLVCALVLFCTPAHAAPQPAHMHPVRFVEFYTSEACSSCLAADAAFAQLASETHVIALGFHVAYWDYLGWTDRFALHVADQRQWDYAHRWHSGEVFTPEMIINGTISGVGSNMADIRAMMRQAAPVPRIGLTLGKTHVVISIPALAHPQGAVLWIAMFSRGRDVAIGHGENAGHMIHEVDIVRFAKPVDVLAASPAAIPVPLALLQIPSGPRSDAGIAAFVQEPGCGPVDAAGQMFLGHTATVPR
jgi:hypothetical protein